MMTRPKMMAKGILVVLFGMAALGAAPVEAPRPSEAVLQPLDWPAARRRAIAWATARHSAEGAALPKAAGEDWNARERHARVIALFTHVDERTAKLLTALDPRQTAFPPPDPTPLLESAENDFYRTNLAIEAARMLANRRLYDEALAVSEHVDPTLAIDPATWLFYRAVCQKELLQKQAGLETIARLLSVRWPVPESYRAVAELMKTELERLKPDSLGQVAGLMRDVQRRLHLARGGERVQTQEKKIVDMLEDMIKKLKQKQKQQQQQQSSSGQSGNRNRSANPADVSRVKGSTAPGNVDDKGKMAGGEWGNLPPRERQRAKNELQKAFPSNYSRLINAYFLKRAQEDQ